MYLSLSSRSSIDTIISISISISDSNVFLHEAMVLLLLYNKYRLSNYRMYKIYFQLHRGYILYVVVVLGVVPTYVVCLSRFEAG